MTLQRLIGFLLELGQFGLQKLPPNTYARLGGVLQIVTGVAILVAHVAHALVTGDWSGMDGLDVILAALLTGNGIQGNGIRRALPGGPQE